MRLPVPEPTAPACHAPEPNVPFDDGFLENLRDGLHRLAQPLTLLQTRLEAALLFDENGNAAGQFLALLAADVERACQNFHAMQRMVGSYSPQLSSRLGDAPLSGEPS